MSGMKAVTLNGKVMLFGSNGTATTALTADAAGTWTALTAATQLDADAYKSVIVKDNMLYTLSNGTVMTSADGTAWTAVAAADIRQLLGAGTSKMYAMDAAGRPVSSADNGATWTATTL